MDSYDSDILELKTLINSLKQEEKATKKDYLETSKKHVQVQEEYNVAYEQFSKSSDEKNKLLMDQKSSLEKEIHALDEQFASSGEEIASLTEQKAQLGRERESKVRQINGTIKEYMQILSSQKQKNTDVYDSFDPNMKQCLKEIDYLVKSKQFSSPPIGPLGALVTIKEEYEADWAVLVQNRLKAQLRSFVVSNLRDKQLLQKTLSKHGMKTGFNFLIRKMSTFNYSRDIPNTSENELRMTDVLDFANEQIKCVFVDLAGVHTLILGKDYDDAKALSVKYPRNVVIAITKENGYLATFPALERDYEEKIAQVVEQIRSIKKSQLNFRSSKRGLMEKLDGITTELEAIQDSDKVENLKNEVLRLQEVMRVTQSSLDNLNNELKDNQSKLKIKTDELNEHKSKNQELVKEMNDQAATLQNIVKNIHEVRLKIKNAASEYEVKQKESDLLAEKITAKRNSFKEKKALIEPYQADIISIKDSLSNDSKYQIEQRIKKLEDHLNENSEYSVEDLPDLEMQALDAITKFKRERVNYKSFKSLLNKMHNLLHQKKLTYLNHQTDCFKETNAMFSKFMKYRGFVGHLSFQNPNALETMSNDSNVLSSGKKNNGSRMEGELTIFARSREETETRDVDTLSGGEKSFAQMSLLLATWGVISSRVIALDEFDVFMDNVNREIGTKLIIESLKDRLQTQTIIITPQDITAIADNYINDPHIKIHKMRAIERN
ncbi:unnamed protein product [Hanseniaspora opuntiae]